MLGLALLPAQRRSRLCVEPGALRWGRDWDREFWSESCRCPQGSWAVPAVSWRAGRGFWPTGPRKDWGRDRDRCGREEPLRDGRWAGTRRCRSDDGELGLCPVGEHGKKGCGGGSLGQSPDPAASGPCRPRDPPTPPGPQRRPSHRAPSGGHGRHCSASCTRALPTAPAGAALVLVSIISSFMFRLSLSMLTRDSKFLPKGSKGPSEPRSQTPRVP